MVISFSWAALIWDRSSQALAKVRWAPKRSQSTTYEGGEGGFTSATNTFTAPYMVSRLLIHLHLLLVGGLHLDVFVKRNLLSRLVVDCGKHRRFERRRKGRWMQWGGQWRH